MADIDEDELISVAERELGDTLNERQKAGLIAIHEWYFKRLKEKPPIKDSELRRQCKEIVKASEKLLRTLEDPLPPFYLEESLRRDVLDNVKLYKANAEELLERFDPSVMKKRLETEGRKYRDPRGRPANWPLHVYVREFSKWYEEVTRKQAGTSEQSVFVNLVLICFGLVEPELEKVPSREFIRNALRRMREGLN